MGSLRSKEGTRRYLRAVQQAAPGAPCPICTKEPLKQFRLWRIVRNDFPYDRFAKVHHMIAPNRHCSEKELNREELAELAQVKESYLHHEYEWLIEGTSRIESISAHYHLHLIIANDP